VLPGLKSVVRDITCETLDFDDWQILYRETLQLVVEIRGGSPLLEAEIRRGRDARERSAVPARTAPAVSSRKSERVRRVARRAARVARRRIAASAASGTNTIFQNAADRLMSMLGR